MTTNARITLCTSIPPHSRRPAQGCEFGAEWQVACVDSWISEGFDVVSLNAREEIDALGPIASRVEIKELPAGCRLPLIGDFLETVANSGSGFGGIINADCLMIPGSRLVERLRQNCGGAVIAERLNISPTTLRPTGRHCYGFDAFFFATSALAAIGQGQSWRIGETWWDYWLPLAFYFRKVEIRTLPAPVLAHLDHDIAWDQKAWKANAKRFFHFLRDRPDGCDPALAAAAIKEPESDVEVQQLSFKVFDWLRAREPLWRPREGSADDLMTRIVNSLAATPDPSAPPSSVAGCPINPIKWVGSQRWRSNAYRT